MQKARAILETGPARALPRRTAGAAAGGPPRAAAGRGGLCAVAAPRILRKKEAAAAARAVLQLRARGFLTLESGARLWIAGDFDAYYRSALYEALCRENARARQDKPGKTRRFIPICTARTCASRRGGGGFWEGAGQRFSSAFPKSVNSALPVCGSAWASFSGESPGLAAFGHAFFRRRPPRPESSAASSASRRLSCACAKPCADGSGSAKAAGGIFRVLRRTTCGTAGKMAAREVCLPREGQRLPPRKGLTPPSSALSAWDSAEGCLSAGGAAGSRGLPRRAAQ